jgi:hypothetical protein
MEAKRYRATSELLQTQLNSLCASTAQPSTSESYFLLQQLKASSRQHFVALDKARTEVQEYKKSLDTHHLQLQNLFYKKQHLLRELSLCHDFMTTQVNIIFFIESEAFRSRPFHRDVLFVLLGVFVGGKD